ncbi:MAG: LuxR family transcriptional regulator [Bacteroidetes bacterium CG18_big_fil_WC_8_21_14_2_50_41_14]|nr:MAG: LuxR family transcriptional regulator [Bacteroidetes bacterium CG18_big_fil_WC_8_21_14_2_50_41_14]
MAAKKVDVMELKQLLQLKMKDESNRSCEKKMGIHRNTINHYVRLFKACGIGYELLLDYDDKSLMEMFPVREALNTGRYSILSGYFTHFEGELKKTGCTREVLWREYIQNHPDGYGYSQFNEHFARWRDKVKTSGKLIHKAGDQVYVDYTGQKLRVTDRYTGEITEVEVFVGILPASQYTYVEASMSQKKEDFISSMNRCLTFFEGVPKAIVTDNLKSAVSKASKYEAVLNKSLKDFAIHYKTSINPTRGYSPQDKALVEGAVKLVYQRIFYDLNKMIFFDLPTLNQAIGGKLFQYNNYLMKQLETSRTKQFLDIEKPYLSPLPTDFYELKEYRRAKVQKMGFVYLSKDKNYYSVPYRYIGQIVEVQYNSMDVEIYFKHDRIATHKRNYRAGSYTKIDDHLSSAHKFYQGWSPEFFLSWAKKSGANVEAYIGKLLQKDSYPELAYKQCLGVINLNKLHTDQRLDNACKMALDQPRYGYHIIKNILVNKMDLMQPTSELIPHIAKHDNIRGSQFYN